jgi:uncharacterized protein YaeQ
VRAAIVRSDGTPALAALAERSMHLHATIQDGAIMLSSVSGTVHLEPQRWK